MANSRFPLRETHRRKKNMLAEEHKLNTLFGNVWLKYPKCCDTVGTSWFYTNKTQNFATKCYFFSPSIREIHSNYLAALKNQVAFIGPR